MQITTLSATAISLILLIAAFPTYSQPSHPDHHDHGNPAGLDDFVKRMINRFGAGSEFPDENIPGGRVKIDFPLSPEGEPDYYSALDLANKRKNRLIHDKCYSGAFHYATARIGSAEAAEGHMGEHVHEAKTVGFTYGAYLKELYSCKAFCGPLVAKLLQCHIESVARNPRELILFGHDSFDVKPSYRAKIQHLADKWHSDRTRRIAVIGRSSRTPPGDPLYNKSLARFRADATAETLRSYGVPREYIDIVAPGWESHQLSEWVTRRYNLDATYRNLGDIQINQSTLLVLYSKDTLYRGDQSQPQFESKNYNSSESHDHHDHHGHLPAPRNADSIMLAGTLSGRVKLAPNARIPKLPPLQIPEHKMHCQPGKLHPNEALLVAKNRGIANAVISLEPSSPSPRSGRRPRPSTRPTTLFIDQKDCVFLPRVQVAPAGSSLIIQNSDNTLHSVRAHHFSPETSFGLDAQDMTPRDGFASNSKTILGNGSTEMVFDNPSYASGDQHAETLQEVLTRPGLLKLTCNVGHPWMTAYIHVTSDERNAVTNSNGDFSLEGVPPGDYRLRVWHEYLGTLTRNLKVVDASTGRTNTRSLDFSFELQGGGDAEALGP